MLIAQVPSFPAVRPGHVAPMTPNLWCCVQTISGLRLTDNFLKRTYEHDEIAQVFVIDEDTF